MFSFTRLTSATRVSFSCRYLGLSFKLYRQLREQGVQLRAENEQLSQARDVSQVGSSRAHPSPGNDPPVAGAGTRVTERLIVLPRECRCPVFNGPTGISIVQWKEELQVCKHFGTLVPTSLQPLCSLALEVPATQSVMPVLQGQCPQ